MKPQSNLSRRGFLAASSAALGKPNHLSAVRLKMPRAHRLNWRSKVGRRRCASPCRAAFGGASPNAND